MKNYKGKNVLITGASSGIGAAFAHEFAQSGSNLILTARTTEKLEALAVKLRNQYGVTVTVFTGDLAQKETPEQLYGQIKKSGLSVAVVVNNAGIGKWTHFLEETAANYEAMLELNINALVRLTQLFIPEMLENKSGGIINIASTGALQPCPYVAVYCASKAFVLSFSEALYGEYSHQGVTVTAVCPGNTATGFQAVAKADTAGMPSDTPEKVAKEGVKAFLKGQNNKIIGRGNYLQSFLPRALPRKIMIKIVATMMGKKVKPKSIS